MLLRTFLFPLTQKGQLFQTFIPTQADLEEWPHIVLTSEEEWDPLTVNMQRKPDKWINSNELFVSEVNRNIGGNLNKESNL